MSLILRWFIFIKERFEPVSHTLMIASFAAANATLAYAVSPFAVAGRKSYLALGFLLIWLVFFHMRLFDDIKDYETDKLVNKERPLPRGVLTINEFGAGILLCVIAELVIAVRLGFNVFATYLCLLAFTLIMRQEFFIGDWMRPKMELYAITHTFSAAIQGLLIFSVVTGRALVEIPASFLYAALGNWFVFNVFEFGRKTFAADEEREGVDSYSLRLGPAGAVALLGVNVAAAFALLCACLSSLNPAVFGAAGSPDFRSMIWSACAVSLLVMASGVIYAARPGRGNAKLYRGVVSFYLIAYHLAIVICGILNIK